MDSPDYYLKLQDDLNRFGMNLMVLQIMLPSVKKYDFSSNISQQIIIAQLTG